MGDVEGLIKENVRDIKDYPKDGVVYRDITPLLKDGAAFSRCVDEIAARLEGKKVKYVVGIEARGFVVSAAVAYKLKTGLVLVRKAGKLPHETISKEYALEYGNGVIEIHKDSIQKADRVAIVEDLLATGGTAKATAELLGLLGAKVSAMVFLIELTYLGGRKKLPGYDVISLAKY